VNRKILLITGIIVLAFAAGVFILFKSASKAHQAGISPTPQQTVTALVTESATSAITAEGTQQVSVFADPVKDFKSRVTKKPFGIYITPQNSPVQPERFTGYHTGADAEYQDITADVPVFAIADCKVVLSETASGYGGVFMVSFDLDGATHTALYGHIRPSSLPVKEASFKRGDQLAVLGTAYSTETDGERRHLHFSILVDSSLNIKGYVQTKAELSGWIDPLTIF